MNTAVFSKQFSKTNKLTFKEHHLLNKLYLTKLRSLTPSRHTLLWTKETQVIELPFIVKVKLIKTIKSVIPQISYHYVSPQMRFTKSVRYVRNLTRNTSSSISPLNSVFAEVLKI